MRESSKIILSVVRSAGPRLTAAQCVEGMAAGLYEELFTAVVSLINRYGCFSDCLLQAKDGFHEHTNVPEQQENS